VNAITSIYISHEKEKIDNVIITKEREREIKHREKKKEIE